MVVIKDAVEANHSCHGVRKIRKAVNREDADQLGSVAQ